MSIENLVKIIPPPETPYEPFAGPWAQIEAEIGSPLPQDYKDFGRLYGSGLFMEFIGLSGKWWLPEWARNHLQGIDDLEAPYPFWPEAGGLLPFTHTDNGDYLFWLMRGAPSEWPIVVWDRGAGEFDAFETFNCGFADFLVGLATGEILPKAFPEMLPCDQMFAPTWKILAAGKPPIWMPLSDWHRRLGVTRRARPSGWRFGRGSDWRREP